MSLGGHFSGAWNIPSLTLGTVIHPSRHPGGSLPPAPVSPLQREDHYLAQKAQKLPGWAGLLVPAIHHWHGFGPSPGLPLPPELLALLSLKHRIVLS